MLNIQDIFTTQLTRLQSNAYYQKTMVLPQLQRWAIFVGIFMLSQIIVFGGLYIVFGKIVVIGFFASILAGLATGLGALPVLFFRDISNNTLNAMLGLAAGVMLAATSFALIVPGVEFGNALWPDKGLWVVAAGMLLGALFLHFTDEKLPHLHFNELSDAKVETLQKLSLFIIAITIHNFPEGMSVGVSFGSGDIKNGIVLATAIGIQNIPEGLAVALPLVGLGYNKWKAIGIATLTGLVEPVGGLLGITMVTVFAPILPIAMGFAAGAMLFVISEEIIPETHASGRSRIATFSLMIGFIIMLALEELLG
ncbi:MAG: ZIP family metal transporter [Methylococcaceae bacterium]|nr:ZIP family metal transporter [Methylococcaceae bacterium]